MSALILAALLAAGPTKACVYLMSDPVQVECSWLECDASTPPVCRRVTERSSASCTCTERVYRTECDADGKNCRTWKREAGNGDRSARVMP